MLRPSPHEDRPALVSLGSSTHLRPSPHPPHLLPPIPVPAAIHPPLSSSTPTRYDPCGEWQMQDHPGAPGTARQGPTRTVVPAACGGAAAHPPRAPGQEQPRTVQRAARPDRPRAAHRALGPWGPRLAQRAPDQDVPRATTARAPGSDRPCAALSGPVPDRSRAAQKAPGQERPRTAQRAVGPDRPRAAHRALGPWGPRPAQRAPGHDVPPASTARAPGHGRPCAAQLGPAHQRSHHAPMAPPAHAPARAGMYVPNTTAPWPARVYRLLQDGLVSVTPHPLIHPTPPRSVGRWPLPSPGACSGGGPGRGRLPTHQVHLAIQVPLRPPPATTGTGGPRQPPSRAPPLHWPLTTGYWSMTDPSTSSRVSTSRGTNGHRSTASGFSSTPIPGRSDSTR